MGKFDGYRRSSTIVIGSGIEVELISLLGEHQKLITINDEKKRRKGLDKMLLSCTKRIGDNEDLVMKDITKLFSTDRKEMLIELRQLSTNRKPEFKFDYEFPVKNGQRRKQRYNIEFNKNDFPVRPYYWVLEKMVSAYKTRNEIKSDVELSEEQEIEAYKGEFPVMFTDYDEIIDSYKEQKTVLELCEITIHWTMLDGESEAKFARLLQSDNVSSHSIIESRKPLYFDNEIKEIDISNKDTALPVPLDKMDLLDIEQLRSDIDSKEGKSDTMLVVQYKEDSQTQAMIDLISTAAFFFPSLAI